MLPPAWYISSSDRLACCFRKSHCAPLSACESSEPVVDEPSSNGARASTNDESVSTSDARNWQSPLKSPHTWALHGSHASSRRLAGCPARVASRAGVSGCSLRSTHRPLDVRLTYPWPATIGWYCSSEEAPDPLCTTMLAISPSMRTTPEPTTFNRTVPSVICELTDDAVSDALSTTSVLGLSNCVAMPEKEPPSVHDAPDAELSCVLGRGPSLIWNALSCVPLPGRTCTATSRWPAPAVYGNCKPRSEPKSTSIGAAFKLANLLIANPTPAMHETLAPRSMDAW